MLRNLKGVLARLLLAAALACASAAVGLAVPRAGGADSCPMSRTHDCCKRAARKAAEAPRLLPVRLCCVTNTPQPAPAGTTYNSRPAPGAANGPRPAAAVVAPAHAAPRAPTRATAFSPAHSPPAYIRHASFLI